MVFYNGVGAITTESLTGPNPYYLEFIRGFVPKPLAREITGLVKNVCIRCDTSIRTKYVDCHVIFTVESVR